MTTEGQTGQPTAEQQRIAALEADANKYKEQAQTWMGKYTDVEKKLGNKSLDALIAAAEERDILARQAAENDPNKFDSEVERRANAVREEFKPKIEELQTTNSKLASQLKEFRVVDRAISKHTNEIYQPALDEVKTYIRTYCDEDEHGNTIVKDEHGKQRFSPANPSVPMTVDELFTELQAKKDHWFINKTAPGGHSAGNKRPAGDTGPVTWEQLSKLKPEEIVVAMGKLAPHDRSRVYAEAKAAGVKLFGS